MQPGSCAVCQTQRITYFHDLLSLSRQACPSPEGRLVGSAGPLDARSWWCSEGVLSLDLTEAAPRGSGRTRCFPSAGVAVAELWRGAV